MATLAFEGHYKANAGGCVSFSAHYASKKGGCLVFTPHYKTSSGSVCFETHYKSTYGSSLSLVGHYAIDPQEISLSSPRSLYDIAIETNDAPITIDLKVNGHSLGEVPYQFIVNENLSNTSTASLSIKDHTYSYVPDHPNSWADRMSEYSLDESYNPTSQLIATIVWGGVSFAYDFLGHSWSYSWTKDDNALNFKWSLVDHSLKWKSDYTSDSTVRSTRSAVVTNAEALGSLAQAYNIRANLSLLSLVYPVALQNRQSARPEDWAIELVNGSGDEYVWANGNTFTPFYPNKNSPNIVVDFSKHVLEESVSGSWSEIYNHVVIARAVEASAHRDATNSTNFDVVKEVDTFNDYEIEFSEPMFNATWKIVSAAKGIFSDFVFLNKEGRIVKIIDARAPSRVAYGTAFGDGGPSQGVKKIRFSWGIPPGIVGLTGDYGKIIFTGIPYPDPKVWGGDQLPKDEASTVEDPLPSFRSEAEDSWSISRFGRKRLELPANPIIATKQQADLLAIRNLAKVARRSRKGDVLVNLNPKIKPGCVVLEKIYIKDGNPFTRIRFVTEVEHSFSNTAANRYTRYSGTTWEGL